MSAHQLDGNKRYLTRITSEHRIRPKFMAMNAAYLDKLQDIYQLYAQMLSAFDLDTAVGRQLDVLGEIVGADRVLDFNPTYAASKLEDEQYRKLIRAQISTNQWDGTMRGLIELWEGIFGAYRIKILDRQDMSILAQFEGVEDLFEAELISKGYFAPRPEGVMVNYLFVMESIVDGECFIAGSPVDEFVWDQTKDYMEYPEQLGGELFAAGAVPVEFITEDLASFALAQQDIVCSAAGIGGSVVDEIITEYLKG